MGKMKKERREVSCIWMLLTSSSGKVPLESNNSWDLDHRQKSFAIVHGHAFDCNKGGSVDVWLVADVFVSNV
jgi:hypothetical protein